MAGRHLRARTRLLAAGLVLGLVPIGVHAGTGRDTAAAVQQKPLAVEPHGLSCDNATAATLAACVSRLLSDPQSPYSRTHRRTAAERTPVTGPRTTAAAAPSAVGAWQVVSNLATPSGQKVNAVHVSLLPSGSVLVTAGSGNNPGEFAAKVFRAWVWSPVSKALAQIADIPDDLFCSGHMHLADGTPVFFGGTEQYAVNGLQFKGTKRVYTFDLATNQFRLKPDMAVGRWYPSAPANAVGNPVIVSGIDENAYLTDLNETFSASTGRTTVLPGRRLFPMYAGMHLLASGSIFYSGANVFGRVGAEPGIWTWSTNAFRPVPGLPVPDCRNQASSVMLYPAQAQRVMVTGVVQNMTGESAQRAALGAGAIVIDVLASNDGRLPHEKIERIRTMRPDMILMSGGTDGGAVTHVVEMAEYISAAEPRPRFGATYKLPLIYAGNKDAQPQVKKILGEKAALVLTDNIRPVLERENLAPARNKIHDLFLEHVMQQAPGYKKLIEMAGAPIMPTPAAVGVIMETIAKREHLNLIGVDIGGATTDVFSVFEGNFNRTVSANLGMSYSISNVLAEAGLVNIMRWVPFTIDEQTLRNRIKNKMVRPTTIPQTLDELQIEHAIAREALRLALIHHKSLATALKGIQQERTISDVFEQQQSGKTLIDMLKLDLIVGSGGILSHAPRRVQSMLMMVDAYEPLGVTKLSVDSIFMMPHLGVLSTIDEKAATDVFVRDCMVYLGTCVAPIGQGKDGERYADYVITFPDGRVDKGTLSFGDLRVVSLAGDQKASITIQPAKQVNLGAGAGVAVTREVQGGVVGLLLDGRGRPLQLPTDHDARVAALTKWYQAVDLYPKGAGSR